jgi:cardiolipin synthase A/B
MRKKSSKKVRYNKATTLRFLQSGEEYFTSLLGIIHEAKRIIYLQMYTLDPDNIGHMITQALKQAVQRNVKVYVLLDAYGSRAFIKKEMQQIQDAGIHCRSFSPIVFLKLRAGRRLHHKIAVVDGEVAIIGGINISDKYRGDNKTLPWLDFGLYLTGPVVTDLGRLAERMYYPDRIPTSFGSVKINISDKETYSTAVVHSDWFRRKNKINYHFKQAIRHAENEIIIICSYFLPSFRLITLLKRASQRGIRIQLYLQGKSDVPIVRDATRFFYRIFFRQNMQIFEFPERVLHGKLWMVDNKIISIGSYNFNHLSEYTSVETNMQVAHQGFCKGVRTELDGIFEKYAEQVPEEFYIKKLNFYQRFRLWASYTTTTFLMKLAFAFTSKSS